LKAEGLRLSGLGTIHRKKGNAWRIMKLDKVIDVGKRTLHLTDFWEQAFFLLHLKLWTSCFSKTKKE